MCLKEKKSSPEAIALWEKTTGLWKHHMGKDHSSQGNCLSLRKNMSMQTKPCVLAYWGKFQTKVHDELVVTMDNAFPDFALFSPSPIFSLLSWFLTVPFSPWSLENTKFVRNILVQTLTYNLEIFKFYGQLYYVKCVLERKQHWIFQKLPVFHTE